LSHEQSKADEFMALLQPVQQPLQVYCQRMLRDRREVEDLLQCAVTTAFAQFDRYAMGTNFRAWLFRIATLEIFNRNRKRQPVAGIEFPFEAVVESESLGAPDDLAAMLIERPGFVIELLDDALAKALEDLPAAERTVLLLRSVGEFSYREIHQILAIPLGSVMGYLSRARKKLRQTLAGYAAERGMLPRPVPGEKSS